MSNFVGILMNIILPVFIQIGIGFLIQKKFHLSLQTLSKVQFYAFIPALLFSKIYSSDISGSDIGTIMIFGVLLFAVTTLIATVASRVMGFDIKREKAIVNAVTLLNSGNFGLPLVELLYAGPLAATALTFQVFFMLTQNLLMNTFGLFNCTFGKYSLMEGVKKIAKMPMIYTIIIAFAVKLLVIPVPGAILSSTEIMGRAMVPVAIFTLGAQLAETKIQLKSMAVYLPVALRLLVGPLIGFSLIKLFGIEGLMAQVMLIASAAPSAVNSMLLSIEFDSDPEYASQIVFISTLMSAVSVSIVIMIGQNLFPIL